jgi:glycosyltransferase involved in cell wall biosynthesis
MNIAVMGFRGIPAKYGGFETFIEELAPRLAKKGHSVTVYGRSNIIKYRGRYYKGVRIIVLPTISHKYIDTVFHTFLCVLHALFQRYDIIFILNAANSIFSFLPRLTGKRVVVNVDGIERRRKKWSLIGKLWYLSGEFFSAIFPNRIVSDARAIQDYYRRRYRKDSTFIPYGAYTTRVSSDEALKRFGIQSRGYILYISRLEPENNAHLVIKAFEKVKTDKTLVIVGDAPYARKYVESLKKTKDKRIIFTGYVFGQGYRELQSHAYCYIHATEVGGTHPALIEAMGFGNCVIANGTPENIEVLGKCGLIYKRNDVEDLREKIRYVLNNPQIIHEYGERAQKRIGQQYNWDSIAHSYETLFRETARR